MGYTGTPNDDIMEQDYINVPLTRIRRQDRSQDQDPWIKQYLRTSAFGTISLSWKNQPFSNSNIFVYAPDKNVISFIRHVKVEPANC